MKGTRLLPECCGDLIVPTFCDLGRNFLCSISSFWGWVPSSSLRPAPTRISASGCEEMAMSFDYVLATIVVVGILIYLTYALLRPERF